MRSSVGNSARVVLAALSALFITRLVGAAPPAVNESAREIPVAYEVDVVVVGGSTGAVSAAVEAAGQGARVFLAAPHPYLGDDMTATLRLWLEDGETPMSPLAKRVFSDEQQSPSIPDPNRIDYTYEADLPSSSVHKDTSPPSRLTDGAWGNASRDSVQYDGDVTIVADLKKRQQVAAVKLMVYNRGGAETREQKFRVDTVTVSTSDDQQSWTEVGTIRNKRVEEECCITLAQPAAAEARYVKFHVTKTDDVDRLLLGEIEILEPAGVDKPVAAAKSPPPRPMHVKKTLDDALLEAGVKFLYSCYPTDVLRDGDGNPCGIVMANRAGRQAVLARTIIDATPRAVVARMAGAEFRPFPGGVQTLKRVVIGGELREGENMAARVVAPPFRGRYPNPAGTSSGEFQVIEYTLRLPVPEDSPAAWARADQTARTITYHPEQQFTSDELFQVPPDPMKGRKTATGAWEGADGLPLEAFQPADVPRLYVLGGCADVSREQAEKLLRPLALMDLGTSIGKAAAAEAAALAMPTGVKLPGEATENPAVGGDVSELLVGVRPIQELPKIPQAARALPVIGEYDVVVIGGGTGGAPAGIGAARQGAKTLVVEYLQGLGGVGTYGAISKYYWGNRVGFTATIPGGGSWVIEHKKEWFRTQLLEAGADVWFGCTGCGAFVEDGTVKGAVVVTPQGRGVVLAHTVIDSTGNSDVAAAAGADVNYTDETEFGMQGTGLPPRALGATYTNTDFTISDETDLVDIWRMFVFSKNKYPNAFDHGKLIDTRERRRIVGDFTMDILDQMNLRTYPDTICRAYSNFDTHGYTVDPVLVLEHPEKKGVYVNIPIRCLLPRGLEGVLVTGLGISVHRDAVPLTRMQPDIQNQGYAAGVAAAMAAKAGVPLRKVDMRALQKHLIEVGNLPESVLAEEDSYPLPPERIAAAVEAAKTDFRGCSVIFSHRKQALPLLQKAYEESEGEDKLAYAKILCMLGDPTAVDTVLATVKEHDEWDKGWNYRGMGQFGRALSPLDELIVCLGYARDPKALPAILEKTRLLTPQHDFSHHRAVGRALELIGEKSAAMPLADLLSEPGMTGYVQTTIEEAVAQDGGTSSGTNNEGPRRTSIRELALARALYRCGDYRGIGEKILEDYTKDLRGHLARHAKAVLEAGNKPEPIY